LGPLQIFIFFANPGSAHNCTGILFFSIWAQCESLFPPLFAPLFIKPSFSPLSFKSFCTIGMETLGFGRPGLSFLSLIFPVI
jgi:hypothetical protein